jgi:hypothetical protein
MRSLGKVDLDIPFTPISDVAVILNHLLDVYERRGEAPKQVIRVILDDIAPTLPNYYNQSNPLPRVTANEQLRILEQRGLVRLIWQPGQTDHLLESVILEVSRIEPLFALLDRQPLAKQRRRLGDLLRGDRFQLDGWRRRAVDRCLEQLKARKSPAPFNLADEAWNQDLLAALLALPEEAVTQEIPYRMFSVRVFNDSKRFEVLKDSVARLARRHQPLWRDLTNREVLRELGLVANPGHLYLYGPWQLVDDQGQIMSLSEFYPAVGIPAALAARLRRVQVEARRVVCVENLASFYELIRLQGDDLAAICLWGNPSPACRHLLGRLVQTLPAEVPLLLWADIDYGGLSILAQLREYVSYRFTPYRMDPATLEAHYRWGQPLSSTDEGNLARLKGHPALLDMIPLLDYMLGRGIKLEQEAVTPDHLKPHK